MWNRRTFQGVLPITNLSHFSYTAQLVIDKLALKFPKTPLSNHLSEDSCMYHKIGLIQQLIMEINKGLSPAERAAIIWAESIEA